MYGDRYYKDLNINEKINVKSWGYWRLKNPNGYFSTIIDNANDFGRKDYANFAAHVSPPPYKYKAPKMSFYVAIDYNGDKYYNHL